MCRVLVGLGSGGFLPTALAFVVESTPTHRRNFVVAIVSSGVAVGGVAAAVLGAAALPMLGYRFIFLVGLVPLVVLVPIVVARVPESISYLVSTGRIGQARATVARHRFAIDITEDPAGTPSWPAPSARGAFASLFTREFLGAALVFWFGTAFCMALIFGANTLDHARRGIRPHLLARVPRRAEPRRRGRVADHGLAGRAQRSEDVRPDRLRHLRRRARRAGAPPAGGTQNVINSYLAIYYRPFNRGTGVGTALGFGRSGSWGSRPSRTGWSRRR